MTGYPLPLAERFGQHALAGSRTLRWSRALDAAPDARLGTEAALRADQIDRLSAPRPDICHMSMDRPRIMGILNVTPDSFSDGGQHFALSDAVARAMAMAVDVDILDIGGESTRPGAREVPAAEEIARTAPVIRALRRAGLTTPISIDTRKAAVAAAALDAGADMVNDVTALRFDPDMAALVADRAVPICLMHSVADPETMQDHADYRDVLSEVYDHLAERMDVAEAAGIDRARMIVDPGIGFGKTEDHNIKLLQGLGLLHALGVPVLLGASRKRFIGSIGGAEAADDRMPGSLAVALHGAAQGIHILRVHDTAETRQALLLWEALAGNEGQNENGT